MSFLNQIPVLKDLKTEVVDSHISISGPKRICVYLPAKYQLLIGEMDGQKNLAKIWRDLVIPHPELDLKDLVYLISELKRIGCLDELVIGVENKGRTGLSFKATPRLLLEKAFFSKVFNFCFPGFKSIAFLIALSLSVIVLCLALIINLNEYSLGSELSGIFGLNYIAGFYLLFVLLRFSQSLFQSFSLKVATGKSSRASFEVSMLGPKIRVHEDSVALTSKSSFVLSIVYASWVLFPLLIGLTLASWSVVAPFWVIWISLFLVLLDLAPYRDSFFSRLWSRWVGVENYQRMFLSYLYSNSFFSIFYRRNNLPQENAMIVYATLSVIWSLAILNHVTYIFIENQGYFVTTFAASSFAHKVSLLAFALLCAVAFLDVLYDLIKQLCGNISFPFLSKIFLFKNRNLISNANKNFSENLNAELLNTSPRFPLYS